MDQLFVVKRDGKREEVAFDKIIHRIKRLCNMDGRSQLCINAGRLVLKIMSQFCNGISTTEIDQLVAEQCAQMGTTTRDYSKLSGRITVSSLHKTTRGNFLEVTNLLRNSLDCNGCRKPQLSTAYLINVDKFGDEIVKAIDYNKDYDFDYFGMKTLERSYLMRVDGRIVERPQDLWMRVAISIHGDNLSRIIETYTALSDMRFTHATPTLFNAGTPNPQLSSCYLLGMEEDSIDGIFNTLKDCALISKWAGGIGLHMHNVRAAGTHIAGTNGKSNGLVPMLRVYNTTARYVDQGGGKRNGSFAIYLEPWHADIEEFLEMKKNHGDEESRARDLFYGLWIPDLFMQRVRENGDWHLFCPHVCKGLQDVVGAAFVDLYDKHVRSGKFTKVMKARALWNKILDSQMETGTPYMLYKDAANAKSNQQNLGVIKSSNLCTEIIEYSDSNESAVCNLASICLPKFLKNDNSFDYHGLHEITKLIVRNLNRVIDLNYYPTEKTRTSNLLHRPIGVGVQGLADVFARMKIDFGCDEARQVNIWIFETIYHGAVEMSCELACERRQELSELKEQLDANPIYGNYETALRELYIDGPCTINQDRINVLPNLALCDKYLSVYPTWDEINELFRSDSGYLGAYSSFNGSPAANGKFQFDMWNRKPTDRYNWESLRSMMKLGMRNSLLIAPMPTASTSQIMGNNECFEPFTNNVYTRRTMAGEFVIVNKHMMLELEELGLWNESLKNQIIKNNGSVQDLELIPEDIRNRYKTVWETSMKAVIDMAADRAAYICQSQSMNLWLATPNYNNLTKMHFYAWTKGLKTGMYYLRRKPVHAAQQFTIAPENECINCSA